MTPKGQKAKALLALVATAERGRRSRAWLCDKLWSDREPKQAYASLRQTLADIRKALGQFSERILETDLFEIKINLTAVAVDALIARETTLTSDQGIDLEGDFLEGIDIGDPQFEEWLSAQRSYWDEMREQLRSKRKTHDRTTSSPSDSASGEAITAAAAASSKLSIAVLPFTNMATDLDQQYLSDGIAEDIVTELSKYRELMVIARNSSFQYRNKSKDIKLIGQALGVEYLVDGAVRKAGNRIRITAKVVDAATETHVWADRYDAGLEDVFSVQDEMTRTITATLVGRVTASSVHKTRRKPTRHWAAYDYFLQAQEHSYRYDVDEAEALLVRAIQLDPDYAQAHALLAYTLVLKFFVDSQEDRLHAAITAAQRALFLDDSDGMSHLAMGFAQLHLRRFDVAREYLDKAVSLNPNSVLFASTRAFWLTCVGRTQEALASLDIAAKRDPIQPTWYWAIRTIALLQERRYEEVVQAVSHINHMRFWDHAYLAVAYAYLGRDQEAQAERARVLLMAPDFSVAKFAKSEPYKDPSHLQHLLDGLHKVGLPD